MKITGVRTCFSGSNHYVIIETDQGISGLGEATLHTRQMAVDGVLKSLTPVLIGKDPSRIEFLWQDIFRGTFWRGGPVLMSALSAVDMALWDIKGKAVGLPVYQLLGGKCRDKLKVYIHIRGNSPEEVAEDALRRAAEGYKVLRFCPEPVNGILDVYQNIRLGITYAEAIRKAVGGDVQLIYECHTRLTVPAAVKVMNALEPYDVYFVEDPIRADSPEEFRTLRQRTRVPIGTGEKFGALWDYRTLIEEDLIDFLRPDICNCGGISSMKKIAAYGEAHYMKLVPHGVHHAAFLAAMQVDFAVDNFDCQEDWISQSHPDWLDYDVTFDQGYLAMGDRPGLGVNLIESELRPFQPSEHPHLRGLDGSVQDW